MKSGFLTIALCGLCLGLFGYGLRAGPAASPAAVGPLAGQGILVGEVTSNSAIVQVRLTQSSKLIEGDVPGMAGIVVFRWRPLDVKTAGDVREVEATAENDFIARAVLTGLTPGSEYVCTTQIGRDRESLREGPKASFKTLSGADEAAEVKFVVVTGMNYAKFHGDTRIDRKQHLEQNNTELAPPYAGADKHLGYPTLVTILKQQPDFFVGTGDNVYYDTPTDPRAVTLPELRRKWHEQFVQRRYHDLFAAVPTYWEVDDHDYRKDDCDNSGDYAPSPELAQRVLLEQLPMVADPENGKTYRTHRVSKDLQIWLVENRLHRSPNKMPDGPEKSIWGAEQKAWLKRTLEESDATFKVLISPTPMIGPDDLRKTDNHTNIGGFRHEGDEFFAWLNETGLAKQGFYLICGDRHWQYHSIAPSGIEEFSSGALIDENSRLGRLPGDPKSTDPNAEIRQPYTQKKASGGFLLVTSTPAKGQTPAQLKFTFYDELGAVLYEEVKTAARE